MRKKALRNQSKHICFIGQMHYQPHRDKYAGIIKFAAEHGEYAVQQLDFSLLPPNVGTSILTQIRPEGIIFGNQKDTWRFAKSRLFGKSCKTVVCSESNAAKGPKPDATIATDHAACARFVAELYLKRGFENFAYIGYGKEANDWIALDGIHKRSLIREKAFVKRATEAGRSCSVLRITGSDSAQEQARIADWLKALPKPCGLMAYWDPLGKTVLDVCRSASIPVPEQLSVISTDNDVAICESVRPTLSSLDLKFRDIGYEAARLLARLIDGKRPTSHVLVGFELCERASSMDVKGAARIVSIAAEIIRKQATQGLTTAALADQMHISPRLLELRFAEVLKRSPREEIIRCKLAAVRHLLETTDLTGGVIAERCGFRPNNLVNLFKSRYGHSMRDYRKERK